MPKYPCRNCVYFRECGDNMRVMPCDGRKTKSEYKRESLQEERNEKTEKKAEATKY